MSADSLTTIETLIGKDTFTLNPCTLRFEWGPYSTNLLESLQIRMLMEAYKFAFAHVCGPLPVLLGWCWGEDFFLSQWAPKHSQFCKFGSYWHLLIEQFWSHSLKEPLSLVTLGVLKRDLLAMISGATGIPIDIGATGNLTRCFINRDVGMAETALISLTRTDFQCAEVIANLGSIGLRIRESFDQKRRPCKPWTTAAYLETHAKLVQERMEKLSE